MRKSNLILFGMVMGSWLNIWGAAVGYGALHYWAAPFVLPYFVFIPLLMANIIWKGK